MSKNASLDQNSKATILATLNTDGVSLVRVEVNQANGILSTTTSTAGSVTPSEFSFTDENGRDTWFGVSENDGVTPIAVQCNSSGAVLVKAI